MKKLFLLFFSIGFCCMVYGMETILLRDASCIKHELKKAGFGCVAHKTKVHTRFGGQICDRAALSMTVAYIANRHITGPNEKIAKERRKQFKEIIFGEFIVSN